MKKKILLVSPHTDDVELGMGATISRLKREGHELHALSFSYPPDVPNNIIVMEHLRSMSILGISNVLAFGMEPHNFDPNAVRQIMYDLHKVQKYDEVYVPNSKDCHQSHEVVNREAKRIFKHTTLLGYELPWNSFGFDNDMYIEVTREDIDVKNQAIMAYQSQINRDFFKTLLSTELALLRGVQSNRPFAEAFEVIRFIR